MLKVGYDKFSLCLSKNASPYYLVVLLSGTYPLTQETSMTLLTKPNDKQFKQKWRTWQDQRPPHNCHRGTVTCTQQSATCLASPTSTLNAYSGNILAIIYTTCSQLLRTIPLRRLTKSTPAYA